MQKEEIANKWNQIYDQYDGKQVSLWHETPTSFFIEKIPFFKQHKVKTVLDSPCGDGRNLIGFVKAGFDCTGFDVSDSALNKCKNYLKEYKLEFEQGLLEELNLDKKFDAVLCDDAITHVKNPQKVLDNFYNILNKKGFIVIKFHSIKDSHYGNGEKLNDNQFLCKGIITSFYSKEQIKIFLRKFKILEFVPASYVEEGHGSNYIRNKKHSHHVYFVLALKE